MNRKTRNLLVSFFLFVTLVCIVFKKYVGVHNVDANVVIAGNAIIFAATFFSLLLYSKANHTKNAQAIMRNVYGGFMLKFFILVAAVLGYISLAKPVNKPGLFISMGLYLVYHFIGIKNVLKQPNIPLNNGEGKTTV